MVLKTRPYDVVKYLRDEADMAGYLEAALEDGHPAVVAGAIGDVARALGMTDVARRAGLGRESLYKALSANGNPEFATVLKVIEALGFRLTVRPVKPVSLGRVKTRRQTKNAGTARRPASKKTSPARKKRATSPIGFHVSAYEERGR